jgi:REase_DpnII-MboI
LDPLIKSYPTFTGVDNEHRWPNWRRAQRVTLAINDEHDVQDLLHALLLIFFDDVRREEPVPSFAGGSAKIDFLIPRLEMGIEVKKSRDTLKRSHIGAELIVDIAKYQNHPSVASCFALPMTQTA